MVNRVVTEHRAGLNKFDVLGGTSTSHVALMKAGLIARNVTPCPQRTPGWIYGCRGLSGCAFHVCLGDWI